MANSILEQAKQRLAEIEEEAAVLRRMIDAAEKGTVQVTPAPAPQPVTIPYPPAPGVLPWPQPDPMTPWIVGPTTPLTRTWAIDTQPPMLTGLYTGDVIPLLATTATAAPTLASLTAVASGPITAPACSIGDMVARYPDGATVYACGVRLDSGSTVRIGDPLGIPIDNSIRYTASN
jgi:hypothetical protein